MSKSEIVTLHDKTAILSFLQKNPALHIYSIGDLDDFYWPHTAWYANLKNDAISAIILEYTGMNPPTIIAFEESSIDDMRQLLESMKLRSMLPPVFNTHLSPGLIDVFGRSKIEKDYGLHYKMVLTREPNEFAERDFNTRILSKSDLLEINQFYKENYPDNWFDPRMLETDKFYGSFDSDRLIGIAGIHVYSPNYHVAAIGSIATAHAYRGRSVCKMITSLLCRDLQKSVSIIGLNVKATNTAAISAYKSVGFTIHSEYEEYLIKL